MDGGEEECQFFAFRRVGENVGTCEDTDSLSKSVGAGSDELKEKQARSLPVRVGEKTK